MSFKKISTKNLRIRPANHKATGSILAWNSGQTSREVNGISLSKKLRKKGSERDKACEWRHQHLLQNKGHAVKYNKIKIKTNLQKKKKISKNVWIRHYGSLFTYCLTRLTFGLFFSFYSSPHTSLHCFISSFVPVKSLDGRRGDFYAGFYREWLNFNEWVTNTFYSFYTKFSVRVRSHDAIAASPNQSTSH